jgi:hypothetical protein
MKSLILIFVLLIPTKTLFAQERGSVKYIQDERIDMLIGKNKNSNLKKKGIEGYRVQIHFGANRDAAKDIKSKFLSLYSEVEAYEMYQQPNFKIRVGDCRTRFDAEKLQKEIEVDFPNSFVVQDIVNPKLNK